MKTINLNLNKDKKYVVACSFGPDSMALLDAAIKNNLKIVVAHVNYRKREAAIIEQESLKQYCDTKNIRLYVLDLINETPTGNFQEWARERRYRFFKDVCKKENADAVLVAHQQDDVIETYLMQKNRGNVVKNAGISDKIELFGIEILRPLLNFSKKNLRDYDDQNHVPYAIDESNLTDHYTRNKIRHSIVEKMSETEREAVVMEIKKQKRKEIEFKTVFTKEEFDSLSYEDIVGLLDFYMNKLNEHRDLSLQFVIEIKKAFKSKTNLGYKIAPSLLLELDYGIVYLVNLKRLKPYNFKFEKCFENEFLIIDFSQGGEDRNIQSDSGTFIVRNADLKSKMIIKDYSSKVSRLFIDWKMPRFLRQIWPSICDEKGEILYLPRYRNKFVDNHKSKFVIKTEYFTEF